MVGTGHTGLADGMISVSDGILAFNAVFWWLVAEQSVNNNPNLLRGGSLSQSPHQALLPLWNPHPYKWSHTGQLADSMGPNISCHCQPVAGLDWTLNSLATKRLQPSLTNTRAGRGGGVGGWVNLQACATVADRTLLNEFQHRLSKEHHFQQVFITLLLKQMLVFNDPGCVNHSTFWWLILLFLVSEQQQKNSSKIAVGGLIMNEICKPSWSVKLPNTTLWRLLGLYLTQTLQQNGVFYFLSSCVCPPLCSYHILFPWGKHAWHKMFLFRLSICIQTTSWQLRTKMFNLKSTYKNIAPDKKRGRGKPSVCEFNHFK